MTKNFLLSFLLVCSFCSSTFAQEDGNMPSKSVYNNEIGLNATSLLTDLLGNNNSIGNNDYVFSYKKLKKNHTAAFRLGIGVGIEQFLQSVSFSASRNNKNNAFSLRLGYEWRNDLSKKLQFYYGLDGIFSSVQVSSTTFTSTGDISVNNTKASIGTGPVLGFQFALFDRLLIGTEGNMYATLERGNDKTVINTFPSSSSSVLQTQTIESPYTAFKLKTNIPKALFIIVKF